MRLLFTQEHSLGQSLEPTLGTLQLQLLNQAIRLLPVQDLGRVHIL